MTSFGSLDPLLKSYAEGASLLSSAGPISDAFIMAGGPRDLLNGPVGSGKTTACIKRALRTAQSIPPLKSVLAPDGRPLRRYRLSVWDVTYELLWGRTIKSWQKILNPDAGIGEWIGARPRSATHRIVFEDRFGPIEFEALFLAFGEDADPDSLGGTEYTDAYMVEMDNHREALFINLARSVGRYPSRGELGLPDDPRVLHGRIFGDCNAPAPDSWVYRDWFSQPKPGYRLYRQPGGLHPEAENIHNVGRAYYHGQLEANLHRPWWGKVKIHNQPGYNREAAVVYGDFGDDEMTSTEPLKVFADIPVIIGCDGGATPAAALLQCMGDGQIRLLDEVALERGSELDLALALNAKLALPRYRGCEFHLTGDEALWAGDDTTGGSWMARLAKAINLAPHRPTIKNADTELRHHALREAMKRRLSDGRPGFVLDGKNCPTLRRGFSGTFRYHVDRNGERGRIVKNPDSHVCEAAEYAAGESGQAHARRRAAARIAEREQKRQAQARKPAYRPLGKWSSSPRKGA